MITREQIEERLRQLHSQRQALVDQLNSCLGAIQDCEYWASVLSDSKDATP